MFVGVLLGSAAVCVGVQWWLRTRVGEVEEVNVDVSEKTDAELMEREKEVQQERRDAIGVAALRKEWLTVYLMVMAADWMMGPYLYHLYASLSIPKGTIAMLFLLGFVSSMLFGTFAGSFADGVGRKKGCLLFTISYILANAAKFSDQLFILALGHVASGVGTSLLHSAFEAWMICEHKARQLPEKELSRTFASATFGNGIISILSGLVAVYLKETFGPTAPFGASAVILFIAFFVIAFSWKENYGDSQVSIRQTISRSFHALRNDTSIQIIGATQVLFLSAMYTFVFLWSAALIESDYDEEIPFGMVFSTFMVCIMIGSSFFTILSAQMPVEHLYFLTMALGSLSLSLAIFANNNTLWYMASFLLFEVACGMYFPCSGTIRSKYIPENCRSGMMNILRIPLNAIVAATLLTVEDFETRYVFAFCASCLLLGTFVISLLARTKEQVSSESAEQQK